MKIAVMLKSVMSNTDGVVRHALYLSHELVSLGHQVTIWAVEYDKESCSELVKDLEIRSLRHARKLTFTSSKISGLRVLTWLRLSLLAYKDQKDLARAMSNEYDIVNPHGNLIIWAAVEFKRKYGIPVVWVCNDFWPPAYHAPEATFNGLQKLKFFVKQLISLPIKIYDLAAISDVDQIVVLSELVKSQIAEYYSASTEIVRPGVNNDRFAGGDGGWIKLRYSVSGKSFLLLTVCSLMPRRRLEDVIQAVEILVNQGYDIIYFIVGKTAYRPEYTRFIRAEIIARNLENRVLLVGEVSEEDLVEYFQACDAFVWPADENQSWGMAGTEAMSSGKPIIVSKANGLAEIIEDKVTGFLVPPRSPNGIAQSIKQLIANPTLAQSVGKAGQQLILENYSWRSNTRQMLRLFQCAIDKR
jgi:glycosyltransferase involved in cell wall biosynthesis